MKMQKFLTGLLSVGLGVILMTSWGVAAEFVCDADVKPQSYTAEEQKLVDIFWNEALIYLEEYVNALTTPTGKCKDSAEATVQTYDPETGKKETRCIMKYRDVELVVKHVRAILAEPDKAKQCFDPQKGYKGFQLYTPNKKVQEMSPVAKWIDHPLLTDYFQNMEGTIKEAGLELNENFIKIASKTDTKAHWKRDVSINGLPNLWASVGWIPFYAENADARNERFRGGYLYAEVMGPWGNLRIKEIDGELVGAEIGMTVQLCNTSYPYHYHHPQEIYMMLTTPDCPKQNLAMVMNWDNSVLAQTKKKEGWLVEVDGSNDAWKQWFIGQDPNDEWLTYLERNAIHSFHAKEGCNKIIENAGWVAVWSRTTSRDNEQSTRLSRPADGSSGVNAMLPWNKAACDLRNWKP